MVTAKEAGEQPGSLVGLWGHLFEPHAESLKGTIRYQFRIIRRLEGNRFACQLFSFVDGKPTTVRVLPEEELLSPKCKLYATQELWNAAYEADYERKRKLYEDTEAGRLT